MTAPLPARVAVVRRVTSDYQIPFYRALAVCLEKRNIELEVYSGAPWPGEALADRVNLLPFGRRVACRRLIGKSFWTPGLLRRLEGTVLVILEQASAQLVNYPLLLERARRRKTGRPGALVALIGHGAHFNRKLPALGRDAWRRFWLGKADWFFAYTERSAERVRSEGFPEDRITVFRNTIDTGELIRESGRFTGEDDARLRNELFGGDSAQPTAIFCGRLVPEKQIPFLLQCLAVIRRELPDFKAVIIGDGPDRERVEAFRRANPWCAWVGRKTGPERVPYFRLAGIALHPAPAGLAIVDAFALGLPFATTDNGRHGPEIDYLEPGVNGLLTPVSAEAFGAAVAATLKDPVRLQALSAGASKTAAGLTLETMVDRFAGGIVQCLERFSR